MSLVRWDPFSDFDSFFNRTLPRAFAGWPRVQPGGDAGTELEWSPSADISETDKEYMIRAALPAVKKEDVRVTVDHGMITIESASRRRRTRTRGIIVWRASMAASPAASLCPMTSTTRASSAKAAMACSPFTSRRRGPRRASRSRSRCSDPDSSLSAIGHGARGRAARWPPFPAIHSSMDFGKSGAIRMRRRHVGCLPHSREAPSSAPTP